MSKYIYKKLRHLFTKSYISVYIFICLYLYIYIVIYLNLKPQMLEMCIYVKGKLKTHFYLQIF